MPDSLKTIGRTYLWQDAAAAVRRAIVSGELKAGDRVSAPMLAERLGISRAPAADALRILVKEGLLRQNRKTTVVVGCSAEGLRKLYEFRGHLERFAVRKATGHLDVETAAALRREVDRMHESASGEDSAEFIMADLAFHRHLCEAAGNLWLVAAWEGLAPTLAAAISVSDTRNVAKPMKVIARQHEKLLEWLEKGDVRSAERSLSLQLQEGVDALVAGLEQRFPL